MTTSKTLSPALISFLMLPFVVVVSFALVFLDLERRESVSSAQLASEVNRIYSRAHGELNEFYWKSADTTINVTFQGVQKNLFTDFDSSMQTAHPKVDDIVSNAFKMNSSVSQIRWIDVNGAERYRMNRVGTAQGDVAVVLDKALQDKSQRYYFTETQTLNSGDIYLSRLDLNVENGQIVEPFEPTIRMATPVKNDRNEFQGIVVINFRETAIKKFHSCQCF